MANDFPPHGPIKLYAVPASCSLVPHILLKEIGADFEYCRVPLENGQVDDEFRKINPKMKVPVLALGSETITELPAIVAAISYLASDRHFMGSTQLETIRVYEWLDWLTVTMHASAFTVMQRPYRFADDEAAHASIKAKGLQRVLECLAQIDERLTGTYAVGSGFTAVDAFLYVIYRWMSAQKDVDLAKYPKYTALFEAVRTRPAVEAALDTEGVRMPCDG